MCRGLEGSEEKINKEGTSTSNSSLGSLSVFASACGSSKEISKKEVIIVRNTHSPPSTQCVYTRGKNIKE